MRTFWMLCIGITGVMVAGAIADSTGEAPRLYKPSKDQPYQVNAEYTIDDGNSREGTTIPFQVRRKVAFRFAQSSYGNEAQTTLAADPKFTMKEYLINEGKIAGSLDVDCRTVAQDLVIKLTTHRLEVKYKKKKVTSEDDYTYRFQTRDDLLDQAVVLRNIGAVTVIPSETTGGLSCKEYTFDKEIHPAKCGKMYVWFKPQPYEGPANDPNNGKNVYAFNPDKCMEFVAGEMSLSTCRLISRARACGLREALRVLAGKLDIYARNEVTARQRGEYLKAPAVEQNQETPVPVQPTEAEKQKEEILEEYSTGNSSN